MAWKHASFGDGATGKAKKWKIKPGALFASLQVLWSRHIWDEIPKSRRRKSSSSKSNWHRGRSFIGFTWLYAWSGPVFFFPLIRVMPSPPGFFIYLFLIIYFVWLFLLCWVRGVGLLGRPGAFFGRTFGTTLSQFDFLSMFFRHLQTLSLISLDGFWVDDFHVYSRYMDYVCIFTYIRYNY